MNAVVTPMPVSGTVVNPIPNVTDADVKEAGKALGMRPPRSKKADPLPDQVRKDAEAIFTRQQAEDKAPPEEEKRKTVPRPSDDINKAIQEASDQIDKLESQRADINAQISSIVESLEARGINRHAFKYARRVASMKESKREGLDLSYNLTRQAIGLPVQMDWITDDK